MLGSSGQHAAVYTLLHISGPIIYYSAVSTSLLSAEPATAPPPITQGESSSPQLGPSTAKTLSIENTRQLLELATTIQPRGG